MTWDAVFEKGLKGEIEEAKEDGKKLFDEMVKWLEAKIDKLRKDISKEDNDTGELKIRVTCMECWPKDLDNIYISVSNSDVKEDDPNVKGYGIFYGNKENEKYSYVNVGSIWEEPNGDGIGLGNTECIAGTLAFILYGILIRHYTEKR